MTAVVDSKHQELSNQEIIQIAAQETGSQYSPEQVTASIMAETHEAGAIMMREGNTLFIIQKSPNNPEVGVFRALNADTAQNYLQNSMVFIQAAAAAGFAAGEGAETGFLTTFCGCGSSSSSSS